MVSSDGAQRGDLFAGTGYRAISRLGRGAMGEVFEVEHELLGRRFAAKVLHAELTTEPRFIERMRVEAQSTARLRHPNIVEVTDFCVTSSGRPCVIMERLRGRTLGRELLERGPFGVEASISLTRELLAALAAAHRIGVVHRDLKPDNVFLHEATHGGRTLKVLDFGLARILPQVSPFAPEPTAIPTGTGQLVGTPRYLSPEAVLGIPVDHRADLYAVGLILYNLLTGRGPFDHLTIAETTSQMPEPPSRVRQDVSLRELDAIVMHALRKRPEDRFQAATDFSEALASLIGPSSVAPAGS